MKMFGCWKIRERDIGALEVKMKLEVAIAVDLPLANMAYHMVMMEVVSSFKT